MSETKRRFRTPSTIALPWGYEVTVARGPVPPDRFAEWDGETDTITIDEALTKPAHVRWALLHEMDHAYADWKAWVESHVPVERPDGPKDEPAEEGEA